MKVIRICILTGVTLACSREILPGPREIDRTIPTLAGFRSMTLPRRDVPLGAPWQRNIGPVSAGLPEEKIQRTKSFERLDLANNEDLTGGIRIAIAKLAGIDANGTSSLRDIVQLRNASILRVSDVQTLALRDGASYLWEALKLESFVIRRSAGTTAEVTAGLASALGPLAKAEVTGASDKFASIDVTGADLFVAFRVVSVHRGRTTDVAADGWPRAVRGAGAIGDNYFMELQPNVGTRPDTVYERAPAPSEQCEATLIVTCKDELDQTGRPRRKSWPAYCWNGTDRTRTDAFAGYIVGSGFVGEGIRIDELQLELQDVGFFSSGGFWAAGGFTLRRTEWTLSNGRFDNIPGW